MKTTSCAMLALAMAQTPELANLGLADAIGPTGRHVGALAPKRAGFNIEGLAATPDGALLIGLRNPIPAGQALLVPLTNAHAVLKELAPPAFGAPLRLNLGGLGIRGMVYSTVHQAYFIAAGPASDQPDSAVYRWSGRAGEEPQKLPGVLLHNAPLERFMPEAIVTDLHASGIFLLADDGDLFPRETGKGTPKKAREANGAATATKAFRCLYVPLP